MKPFLIEFNRSTSEVRVTEFDNSREAIAVLNERERAKGPEMEVVLLFAESEEQLRYTHSRYFYDVAEIARQARTAEPPLAMAPSIFAFSSCSKAVNRMP